jgi:hypothetical protein
MENNESNINEKKEEEKETDKGETETNKEENKLNNQNEKNDKKENKIYDEIKKYLNKVSVDEEYNTKLKENPELLFEKITDTRLIIWETFLYNFSSPERKNSESDILTALLERDDQKVIINDCRRTRVRESKLVPGFPKILEAFLTYYCTSNEIHYKQGLNEIFGPLILLKYKFKSLKFNKLYDLGEVFIDQFLPNYFYEKELYSLQSSLALFVILLKYHEPVVYNRLDITDIKPEMYATNPITTLMIGKMKIDLVFELIEKIIKCQDPLIIHFMLVALFIHHREMIINCDRTYLATLITSLTISNLEELNTIFDLAIKLRKQTPYSYRILANKIGFLKKKNKDIKKAYEFYKPQSIPAMPIFPLEIFKITNNSSVDCVDPECKNCKYSENYMEKERENLMNEYSDLSYNHKISSGFLKFQENIGSHICEKCDMKIEKSMQYILLDLRILQYDEKDNDTEKTGFLPKMINVDQDELKSEDFSKIITDRFLFERGSYHFIFLTTSTDTFSDFESNYYTDNLSELDKKKMLFGLIKQQKVDKELNLENAQKNLTWKEIYKLKEYDNFRNTLKIMQKQNFPYVGYVYGGFDEVHEESFKFNFELLFHNEENCYLCKEKKAKRNKRRQSKRERKKDEEIKNEIKGTLWEHKVKIKYSKISELYPKDKSSIHICILSKYKNKNYENDNMKILITLLNDEYIMELYKFEKYKEYKDLEVNREDKEKKRKNSEYYDLGKEIEEKDTELTLFDKFSVLDILSLDSDNKSKNIMNMTVRERDKEKEKDKKKLKRPSLHFNTVSITLDFSCTNDAKLFMNCFKKIISDYKAKKK